MREPSGRRRRPSAGLIVATIALFVALGGTTYAQVAINGADIRNKSIAGQKLKNQSVGTAQLRNFGVQTRDLQNGAVTVSKLRSRSVTGPKIAPGAVTRADLQAASRAPEVVVRTSATQSVAPGGLGDAQIACNSGETLIAGGAGVVSAPAANIEIIANRPEQGTPGATPLRWQGIVFNGSTGTVQFVAHAICATTTP